MSATTERLGIGVRRADSYVPVKRDTKVSDGYPQRCSSFIGGLHDMRYCQGILCNSENFSPDTSCEVIESVSNQDCLTLSLDESNAKGYLQNLCPDPSDGPRTPAIRIIFCTIENAGNTSFGRRLSLSAENAKIMLNNLEISPQFLGPLFGQPDYWSPGDFATFDDHGALSRIDFHCQQPRWDIHKSDMPLSIYMTHQVRERSTVYLVVCGSQQSGMQTVKERLLDLLGAKKLQPTKHSDFLDPFLVHLIVTHEVFSQAKALITSLRYKLYDQLDRVDTYTHKPSDRQELEQLTIKLHKVSQDTDSITASADMAAMIVRKLMDSHVRYRESVSDMKIKNTLAKTTDALNYLSESIDSQKRWLASYKSRKDIAMNLVYNLVTQQDSASSTEIARETKADSESMKAIAALTMVFLPGTFLSSVFGMSMLDNARWWWYVATTLPLTGLIIAIWWYRAVFEALKLKVWISSGKANRKDVGEGSIHA